MKKLILILSLISVPAAAQFTVTETSSSFHKIGNSFNRAYLYEKDGKSKIEYLEVSSDAPYEFTFSTDSNTMADLYKLIRSNFQNNKVEELTLQFSEGKMFLNFSRTLGRMVVQFGFEGNLNVVDKNSIYGKNYSYPLTMKEIDKLFGKK